MKKMVMIGALLGVLLLGACAQKTQLAEYSAEFYNMDTVIDIKLYAPDQASGEAALAAAQAEYARIDQLSDRYSPDSEVSAVNQAGGQPVSVSQDLLAMVEAALQMGSDSNGALNIALGKVSDLWDFKGEPHVPEQAALTAALAGADNANIVVDQAAGTLAVTNGAELDLGSVAKGYATDRAVAALKEAGIEHAIINAGGNVYALGTTPEGTPWQVGVRNPRPENGAELVAVIEAADQALVTSGDDQRYFIVDGVRYHHILDPDNGYPAQGCIFTTIICDNSTAADLLSTACFVAGPDGYQALLDKYPGTEAIMMDSAGQVDGTPGTAAIVSLVE